MSSVRGWWVMLTSDPGNRTILSINPLATAMVPSTILAESYMEAYTARTFTIRFYARASSYFLGYATKRAKGSNQESFIHRCLDPTYD